MHGIMAPHTVHDHIEGDRFTLDYDPEAVEKYLFLG